MPIRALAGLDSFIFLTHAPCSLTALAAAPSKSDMLQVPAVTVVNSSLHVSSVASANHVLLQDDLQSFHLSHFHAPDPSSGLAVTSAQDNNIDDSTYHESLYEDDLGYYPDGAKRTLTDDQIRIFRHSEIQTLLRARRLAREQAEEEKEKKERSMSRAEERANNKRKAQIQTQNEEGQRNSEQHARPSKHARFDDRIQHQPPERPPDPLDAMLDYGENTVPADARAPMTRYPRQAMFQGRKLKSYTDDDDDTFGAEPVPVSSPPEAREPARSESRRFLWPTLGQSAAGS